MARTPQQAGVAPAAAPTPGPVMVTGGGGFAGGHLLQALRGAQASAPDRRELDLLDAAAVGGFMERERPAAIVHLAGFSSPKLSWGTPGQALSDNLQMTLNVLEAARERAPSARIVLAGSGQVYGPATSLPIDESVPLCPSNPYAVSKAACDLLGGQYQMAFDLSVVRLRPFNHAGPGQSDEYVVSSLCRQVAEAEVAGRSEALIQTGDVSARRDFTDVRDVVRAYVSAIEAEPGVYNVCSGRAVPVSHLVELVEDRARVPVRHEMVQSRRRFKDP
ncbi:MAG: NAD-dependent epimerase/dehydratase family protein, partial [Thermoleophilaceae bacterium]